MLFRSGNAYLEENILMLTGIGDITVLAHQAGNGNYFPSDTAVEVFNVTKATQNISFDFQDEVLYNLDPVELQGTASSGLPVSYEVTGGEGYIENGYLIPTGFGSITVKAFNNGDERYLAATPVSRTMEIREPSVDGALTQIIKPGLKTTIQLNRPVDISVKIKNVGNIDFNEMRLSYVVDGGVASSSELYRHHIPVGDSVTFQFSSLWSPREFPQMLCVYVDIENDTVADNDSICLDFTVGLDDMIYSGNLIRNVYPNPADDEINFEFGELHEKSVFKVFDSKANLIREIQLERNVSLHQLDVNSFAGGIYFYQLVSANRYVTGKFVKK